MPQLCGPAVDHVDAVGQPRRVEADLDLHAVEHRAEDRAAADLVLALGLFLLGDLAAVELEAGQLLGRAGDDDRAPAVADRQHRRQHGAHVLWRTPRAARRCGRGRRWSPTPSATCRRGPTMPRRRETSEPAAPISCSIASSSASLVPLACERLARHDALRVARPSRPAACRTDRGPGASAARIAAIWASRMPGPEIAAVVSCLAVGSGSSAASARTHCIGSKPIGRTTTSSRATGSSSSAASPTTSLSSDSMPAELTSSSRFSSQAPPWPPNATA